MSDGRVVWCVVFGRDLDRVGAYLPNGWEVVDADIGSDADGDSVIVRGVERAGWTFADYVAPRLASGLLWASELNPELGELLEAEGAPRKVRACSCAVHGDGSVTRSLCPVHAAWDPCQTMAAVTGRRRKGSIVRGVCSSCGWSS